MKLPKGGEGEVMSEIKERPILFSGPMVRAILEGRKTVTRRVVKSQYVDPKWMVRPAVAPRHVRHSHDWWLPEASLPFGALPPCPYGMPGDRLWVREAWQGPLASDEEQQADPSWREDMTRYQDPAHCAYRASGDSCEYLDPDGNFVCRWRPSIHMPRWASRILLEITDVSVERLQAITYEQAAAEGVHRDEHRMWYATEDGGIAHRYPQGAFRDLWESINGSGSWAADPWVWAVEFKHIQP